MVTDRLQKVIANAGVCSRRQAERLIQEGRVSVNGKPVTRPGAKVEPSRDHVRVDGKRVRPPGRQTYLLLNKPRGYLCTLSDPAGRPLVGQLIRGCPPGVNSVGRLDFNTEGLLLLTNDGEFANRIASAGPHCPKTYMAKVRGTPSRANLAKISKGLSLDGRRLAPCKVAMVKRSDNCWLRITLIEGRNNQIRKMFDRVGHSVIKLRRVQIGFLKDARLKPGDYRHLSRQEVMRFLDSTSDIPSEA